AMPTRSPRRTRSPETTVCGTWTEMWLPPGRTLNAMLLPQSEVERVECLGQIGLAALDNATRGDALLDLGSRSRLSKNLVRESLLRLDGLLDRRASLDRRNNARTRRLGQARSESGLGNRSQVRLGNLLHRSPLRHGGLRLQRLNERGPCRAHGLAKPLDVLLVPVDSPVGFLVFRDLTERLMQRRDKRALRARCRNNIDTVERAGVNRRDVPSNS